MTATTDLFEIGEGSIPPPDDTTPPTVAANGDYDPAYPGSTPDAPYGFKDDGTPYRRRPKGTAGSKSPSKNTPATDRMAKTAANLLARGNSLMAMGLMALGLPMTASSMAEANDTFEELAYQALLNDPVLCKKILSAGAVSGKAGLAIAYGSLGMAIAPAAINEVKAKRREAATNAPEDSELTEEVYDA